FEQGLPTVQYLAAQVNLSPSYLSDMLRSLTGQNAQQHIHHKLIEKAKELLSTTHLTVSEVAYQLGFEHPQSFSKLFKTKAKLSPLEFRQSFN
ncbi:MAG: AraC family transcriptional regulator, partial [Gammaproteobacteria bacterium]